MEMRSQNFRIEAEGEGCYEDVKDALNALDLDVDDIDSFAVEIGRKTTAETQAIGEAQRGLVGIKPPEVESGVEYSGCEEPESQPNKGPEEYHGNSYNGSKYEEAVMPDTKQAEIMRTIGDNWMTAHEVEEQTQFEYNPTTAALSELFHRRGYLKRRNEGGRTDPFEYCITEQGKAALRRGEQKAAQ